MSGIYALQHNGIHFREENEYKLIGYVYVRKPDPDKVYREIAKELMKTIYRCITDNSRKYIDSADVELMLIEAIKKGKEL